MIFFRKKTRFFDYFRFFYSIKKFNTSPIPLGLSAICHSEASPSLHLFLKDDWLACHSEATPKNLVVAPARVCLIFPHKKCLAFTSH